MKLILAILLFVPFCGKTQDEATPQVGIYANIGLRQQNQMIKRYRDNHGIGGGLTIKHSSARGYLRFVYSLGLTSDNYDMVMTSPPEEEWIRKEKIKSINFLVRPEFRCLNRKGFSLYIGTGPAINGYYSFMRKDIQTEDGHVAVSGGKTRGYDGGFFFGWHGSLSMDYRINKHLSVNLGASIDGYLRFEFSGTVYTGQNLTTGVAYVF
jgi:hypothetical protein